MLTEAFVAVGCRPSPLSAAVAAGGGGGGLPTYVSDYQSIYISIYISVYISVAAPRAFRPTRKITRRCTAAVMESRHHPPRVPTPGRAERTIAKAMHLWLSTAVARVGVRVERRHSPSLRSLSAERPSLFICPCRRSDSARAA